MQMSKELIVAVEIGNARCKVVDGKIVYEQVALEDRPAPITPDQLPRPTFHETLSPSYPSEADWDDGA